jgi:hypothetical protein
VVTGDGWASDVSRTLEKYFPFISYPFFVILYCFLVLIIMNLVTGVILENIQNQNQEEDEKNKEIQNSIYLQELDSIFIRIENFNSRTNRETETTEKVEEIKEEKTKQEEEKPTDNLIKRAVEHPVYFAFDATVTVLKIIISISNSTLF